MFAYVNYCFNEITADQNYKPLKTAKFILLFLLNIPREEISQKYKFEDFQKISRIIRC